jgi:hypothetical protein
MDEKEITSKRLRYLKLAYEVQQIAMPYVKKGTLSLSNIYFNYVVEKVHVSMNTFRKMMKEDVTDYPKLAKAYKERSQEQYFKYLRKLRTKRMNKNDCSESTI